MTTARLLGVCVAIVLASGIAGLQSADGRPQYLKGFAEKYPHLKDDARAGKCSVCHCGKSKKGHNNYGDALETALKGAKNVKNADQIDDMLSDVEDEPSHVPGRTFGELIAEGRLPGGPCPDPDKRDAGTNADCGGCG